MIIAAGTLGLADLNDGIIAGSEPQNPITGTIWIDTSVSPNLIKKWNGTGWTVIGEIPAEGTSDDVADIGQQLADLGDDSKITRFERSLIRGDIAAITGLWLGPTDTMPAITQIDSDGVGQLYALRIQAKYLGLNLDEDYAANYDDLGNKYTDLRTYLTGLSTSPKVWDVSSTSVVSITVVPADWAS